MDAKKASKIIKPIYLKNTQANRVYILTSIGLVVFYLGATFFTLEWFKSRPDRFMRNNRFYNYYQSDEYHYKTALIKGLVPYPKQLQEKYFQPRENNARPTLNENL